MRAYLIAQHFLMRANRFQQLRIEVNYEQHRKDIRPEEYRYHESPCIFVVRKVIETARCKKALWKNIWSILREERFTF